MYGISRKQCRLRFIVNQKIKKEKQRFIKYRKFLWQNCNSTNSTTSYREKWFEELAN